MHPDFWIETHFSGYQLGSDTTRGYLSSYVYQPHQSCITTPNYHAYFHGLPVLLRPLAYSFPSLTITSMHNSRNNYT